MNSAGQLCQLCDDTGWISNPDPKRPFSVVPCECRQKVRLEQNVALAEIPRRYRDADFESYHLDGPQKRFQSAHLVARKFAEAYPAVDEDSRSMLLIGTVGTGKTHLAIAILKELLRKGIAGRFYDYCSLLKEIQSAYHPESGLAEREVLGPPMEVEVMVLDDLGAMRPSPWVMDTVTQILNTRYNAKRTTIITTNFPDRPPKGPSVVNFDYALSDRIGERAVSRLREMSRFVSLEGPDYRAQRGAA